MYYHYSLSYLLQAKSQKWQDYRILVLKMRNYSCSNSNQSQPTNKNGWKEKNAPFMPIQQSIAARSMVIPWLVHFYFITSLFGWESQKPPASFSLCVSSFVQLSFQLPSQIENVISAYKSSCFHILCKELYKLASLGTS